MAAVATNNPVAPRRGSSASLAMDSQSSKADDSTSAQQQSKPPPPASSANPGPGAPQSQTPGHPSFRRQRASRACETCHARKVRCDAASLGVPCTNCVAFSIECKIPAPKRKKSQAAKSKGDESDEKDNAIQEASTSPSNPVAGASPVANASTNASDTLYTSVSNGGYGLEPSNTDAFEKQSAAPQGGTYAQLMKPKFVRAPIKEAGRVAYLGESSNLSLLVHDRMGTTDVVHYPLPENIKGTRARMNELDNVEIDILHQRGAFLLPPRGLCDELVEAFFTWVAPVVPVINRGRFMRRYRDSKNPPSLLLLQAILLAGSRVCKNPQLMDANGSTTPAAMTFYKRAKALFDANYEDDRVTIVQSLILMGWYWEGPEDVTKNVFYWSRVAIVVAQGSGMHRSVESSQLSKADKRLWKRIWWTLFTRDRSVAVALGRPCCINTDDSDMEMLTEDDFIDDDIERPSEYPPDPVHVQFFLNYVKLCEIMGLVLSQQYSVACKIRKHNALDLTHSDMALADWLQNCPKEVFWDEKGHHFWAALLHANYYTTLCLLHRAHMPPAGTPSTIIQNGMVVENLYPSRNIAYQAAGMITNIIESLQRHDQLRYTPAFIVYSLFSALIMHVYQMRSTNASVVQMTERRMQACMNALKEVSKIWLVAKMVHTLFESILGNKQLEERLQKAAGRRHQRARPSVAKGQQGSANTQQPQVQRQSQSVDPDGPPAKRQKYQDFDLGYTNGTPAPQESYERSRPQTPRLTPSRDLPGQASSSTNNAPQGNASGAQQQQPSQSQPTQSMSAPPATSPNQSRADQPRVDAFMGTSRGPTRHTTPFQPAASFPGTPPDLFLVTRDSPQISQDVWNNFQPDQLFPADIPVNMPNFSPGSNTNFDQSTSLQPPHSSHGPAGQHSQFHTIPHRPNSTNNGQPHPPPPHNNGSVAPHLSPSNRMPSDPNQVHGQNTTPMDWNQVNQMNQRSHQDQETWSNSSVSQGPIVPTTLNVEDWFQFFGIQGTDAAQMAGFTG